MSCKYTLEERAGIVRAFEAAKSALWDGTGSWAWGYGPGGKVIEKYICNCIAKTNRWNVNENEFRYGNMAKQIVQERLGDHYSFERWLGANGVSSSKSVGYNNPKMMQAHRKAWLDLLIKEFSEVRTIYACKCGCPRIRQDASVSINDPSDVSVMDGTSCPECCYDGRHYSSVPVPPDFDLEDDLDPEYVEKHGKEVIL